MLAEIIETGECSTAMARKWPFASVFPDVTSQVLASGKAQCAAVISLAIKTVRLLPLLLGRRPGCIVIGLPALATLRSNS
jgi:hypothetical protein